MKVEFPKQKAKSRENRPSFKKYEQFGDNLEINS